MKKAMNIACIVLTISLLLGLTGFIANSATDGDLAKKAGITVPHVRIGEKMTGVSVGTDGITKHTKLTFKWVNPKNK